MKYVFIFSLLFIICACNNNKDHFTITSDSMQPNLAIGDIVQIDTNCEELNYGDIVVYRYEQSPMDKIFGSKEDTIFVTKRIVGLPNDSIGLEKNICVINNVRNKSKRTKESAYVTNTPIEHFSELVSDEYEETFPNQTTIKILQCTNLDSGFEEIPNMKIPEEHYFMLGDNRSNSFDSRAYGTISKDAILGKIINIASHK